MVHFEEASGGGWPAESLEHATHHGGGVCRVDRVSLDFTEIPIL